MDLDYKVFFEDVHQGVAAQLQYILMVHRTQESEILELKDHAFETPLASEANDVFRVSGRFCEQSICA